MSSIGETLASALAYLKVHPEEARYTDSAAIAKVQRGLTVTVTAPDGRSVVTDMPKSVGGGDSAPGPGWLFRAALAACDATLIAMAAAMRGVELTDVEVTVDSESNDYGILGIDDAVPAGPLRMRTVATVNANGASTAQLRELVEWAVSHCPVHDAVTRAVPVTLEIEIA